MTFEFENWIALISKLVTLKVQIGTLIGLNDWDQIFSNLVTPAVTLVAVYYAYKAYKTQETALKAASNQHLENLNHAREQLSIQKEQSRIELSIGTVNTIAQLVQEFDPSSPHSNDGLIVMAMRLADFIYDRDPQDNKETFKAACHLILKRTMYGSKKTNNSFVDCVYGNFKDQNLVPKSVAFYVGRYVSELPIDITKVNLFIDFYDFEFDKRAYYEPYLSNRERAEKISLLGMINHFYGTSKE